MSESPRPRHLKLRGDALARGHSHGTSLRADIRAFLADGHARIDHVRRAPIDEGLLQGALARYADVLAGTLPEIDREVRALADAAEIDPLQAVLLQVRRELIAHGEEGAAADCSTLALRQAKDAPLLAQTVDLPGSLEDQLLVLDVDPGDSAEPRQLLLSFVGLLGYLGQNSAGLAVGINMVLADGWKPGIPPYLIVRHLLRQRSVEACLSELERIPRASSRCLTLVDRTRSVQVEMTPAELRVIESDRLLHTNHYLHPDLVPLDRSKGLVMRSSQARLARLNELVDEATSDAELTADAALELLSDHGPKRRGLGLGGLCVHARQQRQRIGTVAAVSLSPATGELTVRAGTPCDSGATTYRIEPDT